MGFQAKDRKWIALLAVLLLAGALGARFAMDHRDRELREEFLQQAQMIAGTVPLDHIKGLQGSAADLASPFYQRLKHQFALVRQANPRSRFVYLLGRRPAAAASPGTPEQVFFFPDSESPDSPDHSPPGQPYDEAPERIRRVALTGETVVHGPFSDRWGSWVTALVPVFDTTFSRHGPAVPEDRALQSIAAAAFTCPAPPLAVFAMDIDARAWKAEVARGALPALLLTSLLGLLALAGAVLLSRRSRSPAPPPWMWRIEPALVCAAGLVFTGFAGWVEHRTEARFHHQSFQTLAASQTAMFAGMLADLQKVALESLARCYEVDDRLTPDAFAVHVQPLLENPGVQAWEWVPAVAAADKDRFEAETRAEGFPAFGIWQQDAQGNPVPASGREVHYPVIRVAPRFGNERALGFDLGSDPIRRAALDQAARTGLITCTDPITLVQGTRRAKGMLICRPVFSPDAPRRLRGFAIAVLNLETFLRYGLPDASTDSDLVLLRLGAPAEILGSTRPGQGNLSPGLTFSRFIMTFGQVFGVMVVPGPGFEKAHPVHGEWLALVLGSLLTITLTGVVGSTLRRREELELLVESRTTQLQEREARIRLLLNSTAEAIYGIDLQGRCTFCNTSCLALLGYQAPEDLLGKNMHDQIHHRHPDGTPMPEGQCRIFQAIREGVDHHADDEVFWKKDGSSIPVEYWAYPQRQDEVVLGAVITFLDISLRKAAERELQEFKVILDTLDDPVYLLSPADGYRFRYANAAACRHYGLPESDLLTKSVPDLDPNYSLADLDALWTQIKEGRKMIFETLHRRATGETVPVKISANRIDLGGTAFIGGIIEDITGRRQAEAALETARRQEEEYGSLIQKSLLLGSPPRYHPRVRMGAVSLASREIDGDFFDFPLQDDELLDVVVGDVMGKGFHAALVGAGLKSHFPRAMTRLLLGNPAGTVPTPEQIVMRVHRDLTDHLIALDSFVTLFYARFDFSAQALSFVDCGHTHAIHYQSDTDTCGNLGHRDEAYFFRGGG